MDAYLEFVRSAPILAALIQFAILGTAGEAVARLLRQRRLVRVFGWREGLLKMAAWAVLGVVIKYGFVLMKGGTDALVAKEMLPAFCADGVPHAFAVSVLTNLVFGPVMMAIHRVEDNLIAHTRGFAGLENSLRTLVWFWIPAHTLTFSLPPDFQIGLAALWSLALGVILGLGRPARA